MGSGETYTTLQSAMAAMSSGDTLIVRPGTYSGTSNVINATYHPPIGVSTSEYTTIRAESPGTVFFDGENTRCMFDIPGQAGGYSWLNYWKFENIVWIRGSADGGVSITNGDSSDFTTGDNASALTTYVYFKSCGSHSEATSFYFAHLNYVLLEDCWGWGNGRYGIDPYIVDKLVARRHVDRRDAVSTSASYPCSSYMNYASHDVSYQNCIAIDVSSPSFTADVASFGAFYIRNSYEGRVSANTSILGCIVYNYDSTYSGYTADPVKYAGVYIQTNPTGTTIRNMVICGSSNGIISNTSSPVTIDHTSVLSANYNPSFQNYAFRDLTYGDYVTVTNSCAVNNTYLTAFASMGANSDYNGAYGNSVNTMVDGTHNITSDPELLYPFRVETGSSYEGVASDSGDIGATILYEYGVDGTYHGETGWDTLTSNQLWPYDNQTVIRTTMSADYGTTDETRGFCATGENLQDYLWEALGNTVPDDIYGDSPGDGNHSLGSGTGVLINSGAGFILQ